MTVKSAIQFHSLVSQWLGEGGKPVPQHQAQARADVCTGRLSGKSCPMNQPRDIEEVLSTAVALTVKRQIELKNSMKLRVEGEKLLHVCEACDCVLRLKVQTPLKFILQNTSDETFDKLPAFCWIVIERDQL